MMPFIAIIYTLCLIILQKHPKDTSINCNIAHEWEEQLNWDLCANDDESLSFSEFVDTVRKSFSDVFDGGSTVKTLCFPFAARPEGSCNKTDTLSNSWLEFSILGTPQ